MSQDIEIDPDSRTIKYYDQRRVGEVSEDAIIEHIQAGGSFINNAQARFLLDEIDRLRMLVPPETERGPGFVGQGSWSVFAEKVVAERDELRDELNGLCEEIRCLKEENDELKEGMRLLSNVTSSKKEHTDIDTDGDEPHAISGYGKFKLIRTTEDSQWMLFLNKESVMLYNRKGKRVRAKFTEW
jgi:hypothetical protein